MNTAWHNIRWLLRREAMEHRRLIMAPVLLGGVMILLNLLLLVSSLFGHGGRQIHFEFDNGSVLNMLALNLQPLGPGNAADPGPAISLLLLATLLLFALALGAAMVSYALGCLFEERRDRSILFWKSLPVSDGQSVAAKTLIVMIAVPAIYTAAALVTGWICIGIYIVPLLGAGAAARDLIAQTHLLAISGLTVAALPVYLLTLAPAVGWLLLCSATARRHPALMAVIVPAFFAVLGGLGLPNPVWHLLVGPILPTGFTRALSALGAQGGLGPALAAVYRPVTTLDLWLGLLFAAACLIAATMYRHRFTTLV
ncbi:hypothetical protein ACS8YF_18305 [Salinisphaera sp. SWV1]|uniref:hypothetical protein n=1 Tax=Salinisphaera sp. SWV1 TaxID=3454139 RepID=UPI003F83682A